MKSSLNWLLCSLQFAKQWDETIYYQLGSQGNPRCSRKSEYGAPSPLLACMLHHGQIGWISILHNIAMFLQGDPLETAQVVEDSVTRQLQDWFREVNQCEGEIDMALVIDARCLMCALDPDKLQGAFLQFCIQCKAVICCRVSPLQKPQISLFIPCSVMVVLFCQSSLCCKLPAIFARFVW